MGFRRWIASGFAVGFIPRLLRGSDAGAGTFGAAVGALASFLLWHAPPLVTAGVVLAAIAASLWSSAPFATDGEDPGWVVIDEVAGTLVAGIGLVGWPWLVAVVVARLADIFKVLPGVAAAERLPGAIGITADDVVAGAYGLAVGWALMLLT